MHPDVRESGDKVQITVKVGKCSTPTPSRPLDRVCAFQHASFTKYFEQRYGEEGKQFLARTARTAIQRYHVWAEDKNNHIVGALTLLVAHRCARISSFTVWPDFIGLGIGTALLSEAESIARSQGCTKLWVYTKYGLDNQKFYLAKGFREEAVLQNNWAGYDRAIYSKCLTESC